MLGRDKSGSYRLYAYGLVGQCPERLDILGIDKQNNVYPVQGRAMCVMVSNIDIDQFQRQVKLLFDELTKTVGDDRNRTQAILQDHEDVVDTLMKDTTIVPFKFGTILRDEAAAAKMLLDEEEKFQQLLAKLTGKAEWGLKIYADRQELIRYTAQSEPRFRSMAEQREKLSKGAAYLFGRKMEEAVKGDAATRLAEISGGIFSELGKDAFEAKLNKTLPQQLTGKKKEMILNAAYLVEQEAATPFCARGRRLREQHEPLGLELEVSGPWPPYSFT